MTVEALPIASAVAKALSSQAICSRTFFVGGEGFGVRIRMLGGPGGDNGADLLVGEAIP